MKKKRKGSEKEVCKLFQTKYPYIINKEIYFKIIVLKNTK